jgi:hypothetical protein
LQLRLLKIESPDAIIAAVTPAGIVRFAAGAGTVDELVAEDEDWLEQATAVAAKASARARTGRSRVIVD